MDDQLVLGILWYAVFVVSATLHEAAHAFTSWKLGDWTAYHAGQVTLNPIPHIRRELIGMVVIPWVTFAAAGWMVGWASAPYSRTWSDRYPGRSAAMSLAGPSANLALVVLAGLLIHLGIAVGIFIPPETSRFSNVVDGASGGFLHGVAVLVSILFSLNLALFVFNMMPIAPFDGQAWMTLLLKGKAHYQYRTIMMHPSMGFLGIFIAWIIMDLIFPPIHTLALNSIYVFYGLYYG
jgi:Zn-dependent protease